MTEVQEKVVLDTWGRYPGFGPSQARNQLRRQGVTVSTRTVQRIMEANGYRGIRKKREKESSQRFETLRPLELAQMDILEFFINKQKVYLLLLLDDFSRFILGYRLLTETSVDEVIGLIRGAMDRYGKMEEVLTDRGFVFYSWHGVPALLAKSVLEKIVSVYIAMRNRRPLFGDRQSPEEIMRRSASPEARQQIGDHYKKRAQKQDDPARQKKLDRLDWLISYHNLDIDEPSLKRAQTRIGHYDQEAIAKSEEAFLTAVRRDEYRRTMPYFFGILKRVQKEMDEQKHKDYCCKRYNEQQMRERERQKHQGAGEMAQPTSIENLAAMLQEVLKTKADFIRETCIRLVKQMLQNLKNQYRSIGVLKKKISDALGAVPSLTLPQRQEAFNLVEECLA